MTVHVMRMATMGLLVSVGAPAVLAVLLRTAPRLDRWTLPGSVTMPGFVVLHAVVVVAEHDAEPSAALNAVLRAALFCGAVLFWAPVLGRRNRMPDTGRTLYLYTAMPLLDLAGVWLVAVGDNPGGLAMIAGMIPMGLAAVIVTWNWITREERRVVLRERAGESTW